MRIAAKTPEEYLAGVDETRRADLRRLHGLIRKTLPKLKPHIMGGMGTNMIAYGTFHYKSASGREGDWAIVSLAAQKNYISLYVCVVDAKDGAYLAERYKDKLPKASIGRSCIRFKRL